MITINNKVRIELLNAMDAYAILAKQLINKLLSETNEPEIERIQKGEYYLIEGTELQNGAETLSNGWGFYVHGEHCLFDNIFSGQKIEVSLGRDHFIENLDPYFFYQFLNSTDELKHLSKHFENPFSDMLDFFIKLEEENIMLHSYGNEYRKIPPK
ncbi:DUF6896 domain-containing protein [Chondrinema litorale]|uniref:DUF6896 domain-containing protein n=1 Tax=Chondrinema litorale TaxID=2994555 RepID=UPI0025435ADA|nr:hypothetical protein [Chondrinema litorale]UZR98877.1 hypothetical protein OQ292_33340 [Chondrinema litorale]